MTELTLERQQQCELSTAVLGITLRDDQIAYAACMDGVYQLDLGSGQSSKLYEHESYVSGIVYMPQTQKIVSSGYDGQLIWFQPDQQTMLHRHKVHSFWSWDLALSPDQKWLASVTGQYLAGGYKYEPRPSNSPSVAVVNAETGETALHLDQLPPVQSVAISHDSRYVAAANLMGNIQIWELKSGTPVATWSTDDFTSWGIIKSHCFIGGIHALAFLPNHDLLVAGMGPMRDPMAGNGRQLWQQFRWLQQEPEKLRETVRDEAGEGLMETLAVHPSGHFFVMAGRLRGGSWNVACFDCQGGQRIASLKTDQRITQAVFSADGRRLVLAGTKGQSADEHRPFGRVEVYRVDHSA